jgi:hypothetical protein
VAVHRRVEHCGGSGLSRRGVLGNVRLRLGAPGRALFLAQLLRASEESGVLSLSRSADILLRTDKFDRIYYSVRNSEGTLVAGDAHLPLPPRSFSVGELIYDSNVAGERVRVAALAVEMPGSRYVVQVAETTVKRRRLVTETLTG